MSAKRLSLSDQKNKKRLLKSVKNVLASSNESFWPVLSPSDITPFIDKLEKFLQSAKVDKLKLSWSQKRLLPKEERKEKELLLVKELPIEKQKEYEEAMELRKCLLLGVNSVSQGIEGGNAACCLIAEEASPRMLVKHIVTMAFNAKVPVLVVPDLKTATQKSLGFSCLALGFKKSVLLEKAHIFYEICETIDKLAESVCPQESSDLPSVDNVNKILMSLGTFIKRNRFSLKETDEKSLYLFRKSNDTRVFKPKSHLPREKDDAIVIDQQFIPLSTESNSSDVLRSRKIHTSDSGWEKDLNLKRTLVQQERIDTDDEDVDMETEELFSVDTKPSSGEQKFPAITGNRNPVFRSYKYAKVFRVQSNPNKIRKNKNKLKFKK